MRTRSGLERTKEQVGDEKVEVVNMDKLGSEERQTGAYFTSAGNTLLRGRS